ncbi:hypothetical protein [Streptomyces virginiae]|uniref:hypothetical protein n=1 Tax=Streptomyces virginiae TaxID=1961 RepID=UPI003328FF11
MTVYEVIAQLPAAEIVRARSKAMAMLDAVLSPEWEFRYCSYDRQWAQSEELASPIHQVATAAGRDDALPILTGIQAEITDDTAAVRNRTGARPTGPTSRSTCTQRLGKATRCSCGSPELGLPPPSGEEIPSTQPIHSGARDVRVSAWGSRG